MNDKYQQCYINYFVLYARAAQRIYIAGGDPQPWLRRALENLAVVRKLGGSFLDVEQHSALAHWVDAIDRVRRQQDPGPALAEMQAALTRCFALAEKDAMCRTLSAQAEWVLSDWLVAKDKPGAPILERALLKATEATQSPETYPDAWQVLAETHLRLARAEAAKPAVHKRHLAEGLAAVEKIFAINPSHALGLATKGGLALLQGRSLREPAVSQAALQSAISALDRAIKSDPLLARDYSPLLAQAQELAHSR